MLVMLSLMSGAFAVTQNELLRYEFEEGEGTIIIDTSEGNYNNHGIRVSGHWETGDNAKFGIYGFDYDGNDYITSITGSETPDNLSVSVWLRPETQAGEILVWIIQDTNEVLSLTYDYLTSNFLFNYKDTNNNLQNIILFNTPLTANLYTHLVISINYNTSQIQFYKDNTLIYNNTLLSPIQKTLNLKYLKIGEDFALNLDYKGDMDELRIFDFIINSSQINELYNYNIITLSKEDIEEPILPIEESIIINYISIQNNSNLTSPLNFNTNLLHKADCELYIDNEFIYEEFDTLGFNLNLVIEEGEHNGFMYCEYIENGTLIYEFTDIIEFSILPSNPQQVTFTFSGSDFIIDDVELWVTTPCLNEGFSGYDHLPFRSEYNQNGAIFEKVINGVATFTLEPKKHDFCLYNARFIVSGSGQTNNYDVGSYEGNLEIGKLDIPNNISSSFNIGLETFDIYDKVNPKAWGQTWAGIIGGLILLVMGVFVLIGGIVSNNGKITFAGALLVMGALGIEFAGIVGLML